MSRPEMVDAEPLLPVLRAWVAAGGRLDTLPAGPCRRIRALLSGEQDSIRLDALDRIAVALDMPWLVGEIAPAPPRTGRGGYSWPNPHPLRKLTAEQVAAAHRLHVDGGMSIRELGRRLHVRLGYASAKSCAMALSDAFRRAGLPRRDRIAATVAASTTHGRASRASRNEYRRWMRAQARAGKRNPWPSDAKPHRKGAAA